VEQDNLFSRKVSQPVEDISFSVQLKVGVCELVCISMNSMLKAASAIATENCLFHSQSCYEVHIGKTRQNKIRTLQKLPVTQGRTSGKPLLWGFW